MRHPSTLRPCTWAALGLLLIGAHAFAATPATSPDTAPAGSTESAPRPSAAALAAFAQRVDAVRERFEVPGIAVALIHDGEVILARGFGQRQMDRPEPVDADTLFAIASNTKAFTATVLNLLAEDGKLKMDDRVIDHLPWFRMSDPYVTREMRIRDLLVHRSGLGLGAGDLLFWPTTSYSNREVAERLAQVPLSGGFRERYAYDNILYGVAQLVIEQVSGQSFQQFLQQRIFDPLGMADTRYNADHLKPGDKVATGHARAEFKHLGPTRNLTWSNVAGAGGLYSSVNDLSRWMRMQLRGGIIDGEGDSARRLFPEARQRSMFSPVTPMPIRPPAVPELAPATPQFLGYGEGWISSDYRGERLIWHTGGWPGQVSRLTLVPGRNAGVVVLTNQEVGAAFNAVTMDALDLLLGNPPHDWLGAYAAAVDKASSDADERWRKLQASRDARSRPSLPLADYAGSYRDPWYGDVLIRQGRNGLELQFSRTEQLLGDLEHWQHDSFIVRWRDRSLNADAFISFAIKPDGSVRDARMEAISPLTDFSFDFQDLRLVPVK